MSQWTLDVPRSESSVGTVAQNLILTRANFISKALVEVRRDMNSSWVQIS